MYYIGRFHIWLILYANTKSTASVELLYCMVQAALIR